MATLGNLACGLIGIERIMAGDPVTAIILMGIAAILDFADGFLARLLHSDSELGKQLDSLADLVTFTVLPGIVLFYYTMQFEYCMPNGFCSSRYAWLVVPLAGAWRLATFNIDTRQTTGFIGVPTPITGLAFGSLILAFEMPEDASFSLLHSIYSNFYFLTISPVIAAWLMVSDLPMLSLKFKKSDPLLMWKASLPVLSILIILLFKQYAGPLIFVVYVLLSIIANFAVQNNKDTNG